MNSITDYNELDAELKSKLNPELKQSIDNFFKIDESSKEGRHINVEEESLEYIDKMLNKPLEDQISIENTIDNYKQKVINIYKKVLGRRPDNVELIHHSNMLRYEVSTEEEIENTLIKSDDCIANNKQKSQNIPEQQVQTQPIQSQNIPEQHPDEYYINIINKAFDEILQRPDGKADPGGLATYLKKMKYEGMTEEILRRALRNSPEYRQNFGSYTASSINTITNTFPTQIPSGTIGSNNIRFIMPLNIVYCMMGTNRLHEIKSNNYISSVLPWIDKFIFIDGGSEDGTVEYLNSLGNKVEVYAHPWQDRFSEQRNHYLEKLKERNYGGWVITSDTDEHYPIESLKYIKSIIPEIELKGYNGLKVQVVDITVDDNDFNKEISRNTNQYWKPLIFKYNPNIRYEGEPHETLTGHPIRWYKSNILYEHRRSKLHILQRATENFFISNSNRWSEKWSDFRFLCTKNNLLNFKDYWNLFKDHKLPKEVEEWIYAHKDDNQDSGDSEVREMAQLYDITKKKEEKKEPDNITTEKKEKPLEIGITKEFIESMNNFIQLQKDVRPLDISDKTKKSIDKVEKILDDDLLYEICPDNICITRISESEIDVIENRGGETRYRTIKKVCV